MIEMPTEKMEQLFFAALEIKTPDQRKRFLDRECQGNSELRSVIDKLIASIPEAEKFFQNETVSRLPVQELSQAFAETPGLVENIENGIALTKEDEALGKSIGSYKLLQKIGEGGCGAVYMAEQVKPDRKSVV